MYEEMFGYEQMHDHHRIDIIVSLKHIIQTNQTVKIIIGSKDIIKHLHLELRLYVTILT